MKRLVLTILIFLLLGAIVNVAVALGCAMWASNACGNANFSIVDSGSELKWQAAVPQHWPQSPESVSIWRCAGITMWAAYDSARTFHQSGMRTGLPYRSMSSQTRSPDQPRMGMTKTGIRVPRNLTPADGEWRRFPAELVWPGFAINTLFYAAILWTVFAVPAALRRKRRMRRGLCPKCAYDLRGRRIEASAACPEGGQFIAREDEPCE